MAQGLGLQAVYEALLREFLADTGPGQLQAHNTLQSERNTVQCGWLPLHNLVQDKCGQHRPESGTRSFVQERAGCSIHTQSRSCTQLEMFCPQLVHGCQNGAHLQSTSALDCTSNTSAPVTPDATGACCLHARYRPGLQPRAHQWWRGPACGPGPAWRPSLNSVLAAPPASPMYRPSAKSTPPTRPSRSSHQWPMASGRRAKP